MKRTSISGAGLRLAGITLFSAAFALLSGCASFPPDADKPQIVKIILPEKLDRPVTLRVGLGEFQGLTSSRESKSLSFGTPKVIPPVKTVTIPAGQTTAEVSFKLDLRILGKRKIVGFAIEKNVPKEYTPVVGLVSFAPGDETPAPNQHDIQASGGGHIGPKRPMPKGPR